MRSFRHTAPRLRRERPTSFPPSSSSSHCIYTCQIIMPRAKCTTTSTLVSLSSFFLLLLLSISWQPVSILLDGWPESCGVGSFFCFSPFSCAISLSRSPAQTSVCYYSTGTLLCGTIPAHFKRIRVGMAISPHAPGTTSISLQMSRDGRVLLYYSVCVCVGGDITRVVSWT